MKLDGGITMYYLNSERLGTGELPYGRKVRFLNKNGWTHEPIEASKFMNERDILTVDEIFVERNSSTVTFVEVPGKEFNTVMFEDLYGESEDDSF